MLIEHQRNLALKILSFSKPSFNLYTELLEDSSSSDLEDVWSFIEMYLNKHKVNYYYCDVNSGDFLFRNSILSQLLDYLLKCDPECYEKLSAIITKCFGFSQYCITKKSHDQGIDVIGYSNHFSNLFNIYSEYKYYIFAQCKKKKNNLVDSSEIMNLTGAITLFSKREFAVKNSENIFKDFIIKTHTPVHAIFTSGYFFSNDALSLCYNCDIIPLDIIDMAILFNKNIEQGNLTWVNKNNKLSIKNITEDLSQIKIAR